jgi:tRNA modification GTPase
MSQDTPDMALSVKRDTTHVIELTPPGRAAVTVIAVAGPDAVTVVSRLLAPCAVRLADSAIGEIRIDHWGGEGGEKVVVSRRAEDRVEIHCHGGAAAVRAVIDPLVAQGCREMSWRRWVGASEDNSIRVAVRLALASAQTEKVAAILLDQFDGRLQAAIEDLLGRLLSYKPVGCHLTSSWGVVLSGLPNVGKSSLLNALAGFQRAIVSPTPGTTRDVVTFKTAIDGWPVQLFDTAGLRDPEDDIEAAGVALAEATRAAADLDVQVHDAREGVHRGEPKRVDSTGKQLSVWNKMDLLSSQARSALRCVADGGQRCFFVSAVTGEGIGELIAGIGQSLVPDAPPAAAAVPFTAEQFAAIESARILAEKRDLPAVRAALQSLLPQ